MESVEEKKRGGIFSSLLQKLEKTVKILAMLCVGSLTLILIASVILRTLKIPFVGADELALFLLIWITFLGATLSFRNNELVAVTFLLEKCKNSTRKLLQITIQVITLLFCTILLYFSSTWFVSSNVMNSISAALQIPYWIPYSIFPIASILFIIFSIGNIKSIIQK
jgi:C4-dicarboxylate transporter DctQ subunit